jgi:hypothetical protein
MRLLPNLIAITHWCAEFFDELAVALDNEQTRQLTDGSSLTTAERSSRHVRAGSARCLRQGEHMGRTGLSPRSCLRDVRHRSAGPRIPNPR